MKTSIAWGIATFNVQNLPDLTRAQVRQCASVVADHAGWVGFQEIQEVEDDQDLDAVLLPKNWIHEHYGSENAIMAKKSRWKKADPAHLNNGVPVVAQKELSKGLAHVTPSRNLTWVIFEFLENDKFTPTALVNTHLVSGVYKGNDHYKERLALRNEELAGIKKWVQYLLDNGVNVVFTADTNWKTMPKFHPDLQWLVNDGIDKIAFVKTPKSNFDLTLVSAERHNTPSDHDMRVANVLAVVNALYVPDPPPVPVKKPPVVLTKAQRIAAWCKANNVSQAQLAELNKILSGS